MSQMPPAPVTPTYVRTCPHCLAQSQADGSKRCPACRKKMKKHTVRNVLLGVTAVLVLMMAGCAALIGGAANEVVEELDAQQEASAITQAQFDAVRLGQSRAQVEQALLPKVPQDEQELSSSVDLPAELGGSVDSSSACLYYYKEAGDFDLFQLCFDGVGGTARLTSKNSY